MQCTQIICVLQDSRGPLAVYEKPLAQFPFASLGDLRYICAAMGSKKRKPSETPLLESTVAPNPFRQLEQWLHDARQTSLREPGAMALATSGHEGRPSMRVVLLKHLDENGLVFYTNYESRKGREIGENRSGALLFFWDSLARQVRVEGELVQIGQEESAAYFKTRPRMSQIGAWASRQSSPIPDRSSLELTVKQLRKEFAGKDIPLPPFWGGYRLIPVVFEFWQGRRDRLHDRLRFTRVAGSWKLDRLAP